MLEEDEDEIDCHCNLYYYTRIISQCCFNCCESCSEFFMEFHNEY